MSEPDTYNVPVFPLGLVLFPQALLPLRIFEPRYLTMISHCLKQQEGFVVSLIRDGREVGPAARYHDIGTLVRIVDWDQGTDGMLHVTVRGTQRVQVLDHQVRENQLIVGRALDLEREPPTGVAAQHEPLVQVLRSSIERFNLQLEDESRLEDASWVGFRLAELLPLPNTRKQWLLELTNPTLRLAALQEDVDRLFEGNSEPPAGLQ